MCCGGFRSAPRSASSCLQKVILHRQARHLANYPPSAFHISLAGGVYLLSSRSVAALCKKVRLLFYLEPVGRDSLILLRGRSSTSPRRNCFPVAITSLLPEHCTQPINQPISQSHPITYHRNRRHKPGHHKPQKSHQPLRSRQIRRRRLPWCLRRIGNSSSITGPRINNSSSIPGPRANKYLYARRICRLGRRSRVVLPLYRSSGRIWGFPREQAW